jgi:hypothetical protein
VHYVSLTCCSNVWTALWYQLCSVLMFVFLIGQFAVVLDVVLYCCASTSPTRG